MPKFDDRTERLLLTLLPQVADMFRAFLTDCKEQGYDIRLISGTRTYTEQNKLYAQGRTEPGDKVTNARGGESNHNFGVAGDIGVFIKGNYLPESPIYRRISSIGTSHGFEWGGSWKFVDEPHYQYTAGQTLKQLRYNHDHGLPILPPAVPKWKVYLPGSDTPLTYITERGGRPYVPVRSFCMTLGAKLTYESETRELRVNDHLILPSEVFFDAAGSVATAPLRSVCEAAGWQLDVDAEKRVIRLVSPKVQ